MFGVMPQTMSSDSVVPVEERVAGHSRQLQVKAVFSVNAE